MRKERKVSQERTTEGEEKGQRKTSSSAHRGKTVVGKSPKMGGKLPIKGKTFPFAVGPMRCRGPIHWRYKYLTGTGQAGSCHERCAGTGGSHLGRIFWEPENLSGLSIIWLIRLL